MAMIVSNAARLKPEIRLAEAISQFEGCLSQEEKAILGDARAQAIRSAPDTTDVMRFTAQIDRRISDKARRCLGPRFTSFLGSVQQFAALGDVVVGGSQNIIACGVWSLVRMSILAMTKYASYIESLSLVFMEIGRSSPRHREMALMYPQSKNLQAYVNEYFIVVVRFCHEMYQFTKKSAFRQFTATLSSERVQMTQAEAKRWATEIQDEISQLTAITIVEEATSNSRFRSVTKKFSKSIAEQQKLMERLHLLDKCSKHDQQTTWKQIRKQGNTSSFSSCDHYKSWKLRAESCTLLYFGILGCGKSVTLANIVDDLLLSTRKTDPPIIFFFTRDDLPDSLQARTIIGSLVRQLLEWKQDIPHSIEASTRTIDVTEMLYLVTKCYGKQDRVFLVIDGLDLCALAERKDVIGFLQLLKKHLNVRICTSIRQEPTYNMNPLYQDLLASERGFPLPNNLKDIASFIEVELARCLENHSLHLGEAALILQIQDALLEGSHGMFLWVVLQIATLCALQTDNEIREALADLPEDLSEAYRRILLRAEGTNKTHQTRILKFITSALRPLTVEEMREAFSVTPGDTNWNATKVVNDVYSILTTCGCVVYVDEEEYTVRLVHPSVKSYFLRQGPVIAGEDLAFMLEETAIAECHKSMADVIVTYLSYGVFDTQLSTNRVPQIDCGAANLKVIETATATSKNVQNLALKILAHRKQPTFDMSKVLAEERASRRNPRSVEFTFVHYARQWCLEHVCSTGQQAIGEHIAALLPALLIRNAAESNLQPSFDKAITCGVEKQSEPVLELLLRSTNKLFLRYHCFLKLENDNDVGDAMELAICKGREGLFQALGVSKGVEWFLSHPIRSDTKVFTLCCAAIGNDSKRWVVGVEELSLSKESIRILSRACQSDKGLVAGAIIGDDLTMVEDLLKSDAQDVALRTRGAVAEAVTSQNARALTLLSKRGVLLEEQEKLGLLLLAETLGFHHVIPILAGFSSNYPIEMDGTSLTPTDAARAKIYAQSQLRGNRRYLYPEVQRYRAMMDRQIAEENRSTLRHLPDAGPSSSAQSRVETQIPMEPQELDGKPIYSLPMALNLRSVSQPEHLTYYTLQRF